MKVVLVATQKLKYLRRPANEARSHVTSRRLPCSFIWNAWTTYNRTRMGEQENFSAFNATSQSIGKFTLKFMTSYKINVRTDAEHSIGI